MTASRYLAPAAAALVLSACATVEPIGDVPAPAPDEPIGGEPSSSPAPIADYDWHLNRNEDEVSLVYGLAESDDVRLSLHCHEGTNRLLLHKDVEEGAPQVIHLESGGDTGRFAAEAEESMLSGGVILTAEANADHPVFQRFRRVHWIASWVADRREPYAAHPGSEAAVEDFFFACG